MHTCILNQHFPTMQQPGTPELGLPAEPMLRCAYCKVVNFQPSGHSCQMVGGIGMPAGPCGAAGGTSGSSQFANGWPNVDPLFADEGAPNCMQQCTPSRAKYCGFMIVSIVCVNSQTQVYIYIYIFIYIYMYRYIHIYIYI